MFISKSTQHKESESGSTFKINKSKQTAIEKTGEDAPYHRQFALVHGRAIISMAQRNERQQKDLLSSSSSSLLHTVLQETFRQHEYTTV